MLSYPFLLLELSRRSEFFFNGTRGHRWWFTGVIYRTPSLVNIKRLIPKAIVHHVELFFFFLSNSSSLGSSFFLVSGFASSQTLALISKRLFCLLGLSFFFFFFFFDSLKRYYSSPENEDRRPRSSGPSSLREREGGERPQRRKKKSRIILRLKHLSNMWSACAFPRHPQKVPDETAHSIISSSIWWLQTLWYYRPSTHTHAVLHTERERNSKTSAAESIALFPRSCRWPEFWISLSQLWIWAAAETASSFPDGPILSLDSGKRQELPAHPSCLTRSPKG